TPHRDEKAGRRPFGRLPGSMSVPCGNRSTPAESWYYHSPLSGHPLRLAPAGMVHVRFTAPEASRAILNLSLVTGDSASTSYVVAVPAAAVSLADVDAFSVGSRASSLAASVSAYEPLLSVASVSAAVWAVRAEVFAAASLALPFWLMNDGIAIAARMPMIRMTTRSSIRVKPPSSFERWRSRYNIESSLDSNCRAPALGPSPSSGGGGLPRSHH